MRLPDHVMVRRLGSETVLLNLETGSYHGLDALGTDFLEVLTTEGDLREAVLTLSTRHRVAPERVRHDVKAFRRDLSERGLILPDEDGGA